MIDNAVLDVAVVIEVVEVAGGDKPHTQYRGCKKAPNRGAHRRRRYRRRWRHIEDDAEDDVAELPRLRRVPGLLDPAVHRRRRHTLVLPIPGVQS